MTGVDQCMLFRRTGTVALLVALALTLVGLGTTSAGAETVPPAGVCVDTQGVLGPQTCAQVTTLLAADEQATTDQIAVLVVDSTDGASIESYATTAFNTWGVGQDGLDNGVLLVVALQDRAVRIEVGDGLRAKLSDGQASEIVGGTVVPQFKADRYRAGILQGLDAVRTALGHPVTDATRLAAIPTDAGYVAPDLADAAPAYTPPTYSASGSEQSSGSETPWWPFLLLLAVAVVGWLMRAVGGSDGSGGYSSGYRSRGSWSSSRSFSSSSSRSRSSGGSSRRSGGFGGGRSSGGGASGKW